MRSENLNQYALLIFLAFTVIASGCISNNNSQNQKEELQQEVDETQQQAQKLQTCGSINIEIVEASSSEAVIQQNAGNSPVGEVEVTWTLQNGDTATKTVSIDRSRGVAQATNSLSGTLQEVVAKSTKCQGIEATYP